VTAFFIPGIAADVRALETAYVEMRRRTELDMGRRPSSRRILSLWTRRGAVDCITEVGTPDPLRGDTVIAIFDMGPNQPFVVWRRRELESGNEVHEVLGSHAYSVLEFDG
jgi:hypothetical protein